MDLKLRDVASLLNVSEATVRRWVVEGVIPHYRINNQARFNRSEVEGWVLSCQREKGECFQSAPMVGGESLGTQQYGLFRALHKGGVWTISGTTKKEVIHTAMNHIAPDLGVDAEVIAQLLIEREEMMSTALSHGVAVPHTRDFFLSEPLDAVALVFLEQPIEYDALDGEKVHTLFFLFACDDKRHLHLLSKIAHFCNQAEHITFLQQRPFKAEMLEIVRSWEAGSLLQQWTHAVKK